MVITGKEDIVADGKRVGLVGEERPRHDGPILWARDAWPRRVIGTFSAVERDHVCCLCSRFSSAMRVAAENRGPAQAAGGRAASKKSFLMPCTILMPKR